jgi:type I restriction-modification system DNA methylase subunit
MNLHALEFAHQHLGWPDPDILFNPPGDGPKILADLANQKIGKHLMNFANAGKVKIGIVVNDYETSSSESPIALVCKFDGVPSEELLLEAHRLSWNFSRTPLLLTVDDQFIRAWSCCEFPRVPQNEAQPELRELRCDTSQTVDYSGEAARSLNWVNLICGKIFQEQLHRFNPEHRADQTLLANFSAVREQLRETGLNVSVCHDLIGRVIFIQFLFHRIDSTGKAALNGDLLERLSSQGVLRRAVRTFAQVLESHEDTYSFFRWLNQRFNGDLFPGKEQTREAQELEWQNEMRQVQSKHLGLLSEFVAGTIALESGQGFLFAAYSFDMIPLDFISSIYEVFVKSEGESTAAHYTPSFLVDFILDEVLPWSSDKWDLRVLDPSCGSGIFLVKAFQRLIYRWKRANASDEISIDALRDMLERNLVGIDINSEAVRVASFSLYLAMCDEIDPKHYWTRVKFPRLRNKHLLTGDFFEIANEVEPSRYDVIIGNAPWGRNTAKRGSKAQLWSTEEGWPLAYGSIGPLFLPRCVKLMSPFGRVCMLMPLGLLTNNIAHAKQFRARLFESFKVNEVINLAALRFGLFAEAVAPACVISIVAEERGPDEGITYICPKPSKTTLDDYSLTIGPHDINIVLKSEAIENQVPVWTALMWGSRRDLRFLSRLQNNLTLLSKKKLLNWRQGVIRGDRKKKNSDIVGFPFLSSIPEDCFIFVDPKKLPLNDDPETHSRDSTSFKAFSYPQLILKQGWQKEAARFRAVMVEGEDIGGQTEAISIICSKSFCSVHANIENKGILQAACLAINSKFAVYYLLLTSGRFASYRPEVNMEELLSIPLPPLTDEILDGIDSFDAIDERMYELLQIRAHERILIDDLVDYVLADFKSGVDSPGRVKTVRRMRNKIEPDLTRYCEILLRVFKAGFGDGQKISARIFSEIGSFIPARLVAIYFGGTGPEIEVDVISEPELSIQLAGLSSKLANSDSTGQVFSYQRIARIYDTTSINGKKIPTVYMIKPDEMLYWTKSTAMRDADEIAAEIVAFKKDRRRGRISL